MSVITFDTLSASRTLRNAGVDERTAEAIVEVVKQTADLPLLDHLITKDDLREALEPYATKADLRDALLLYATKADLREALLPYATKADLREALVPYATKADISAVRLELAAVEVRLSEKIRVQGLAMLGGMAAIVGIATAVIKLA